MISLLTVGKPRLTDLVCTDVTSGTELQVPFPLHNQCTALFQGVITTSVMMRRFYLTKGLLEVPSLRVTSHLQELSGYMDICFHDSFKAIRNTALKPPLSSFTSDECTGSGIILSMSHFSGQRWFVKADKPC